MTSKPIPSPLTHPKGRSGPSGSESLTTPTAHVRKSPPAGSNDLPIAISTGPPADFRAAPRQPLGIFPLPASFLVLPEVVEADGGVAALDSLMWGKLPPSLPSAWQFFAEAVRQDAPAALALIPKDGGPLADYNRFVLQPDVEQAKALRHSLPADLQPLVACVAFAMGMAERFPTADHLKGESLALVLSTQAAAALERNDQTTAIDCLEHAIAAARGPSPLVAAQLLGQYADVLRQDEARAAMATQAYRDALQLAGDAAPRSLVAELWVGLGEVYHQQAEGRRGPLIEAVKYYQNALQSGLDIESQPQTYARAHAQIGLAYLTMPLQNSSDQLRMAIALQSFREALKVYDKSSYPQLWATTQLNLANALQYLPSAHPQENLIQAVHIYDDVLTVRNRATDPLGYARVLLNQSNALAHLGLFSPALDKLTEARKLFAWHNENELAEAAMELASQIHARLDENRTAHTN